MAQFVARQAGKRVRKLRSTEGPGIGYYGCFVIIRVCVGCNLARESNRRIGRSDPRVVGSALPVTYCSDTGHPRGATETETADCPEQDSELRSRPVQMRDDDARRAVIEFAENGVVS